MHLALTQLALVWSVGSCYGFVLNRTDRSFNQLVPVYPTLVKDRYILQLIYRGVY